jgi:hypothetical protein
VALAPSQCCADLPLADVLPGRGFFNHSTSRYHFLTLNQPKFKHKKKMPNEKKGKRQMEHRTKAFGFFGFCW